MRVNVGNGEIKGYLNLLDSVDLSEVNDAECVEILAPTIVNIIDYTEIQTVLQQWYKKLRIGGTLVLGGYDLVEFCKRVIRYEISKEEKNSIVAGSGCFFPLDEITELVQLVGFKVKNANLTVSNTLWS
jgi:hypothetical protein